MWDDENSYLPTSELDNEILFQSRRRDPETGLCYYRMRMYHAQLGRWLQRDPEGYTDGISLYEYCRSGPIIGTDPMGLDFWEYLRRKRYDVGKDLEENATSAYFYGKAYARDVGWRAKEWGIGVNEGVENMVTDTANALWDFGELAATGEVIRQGAKVTQGGAVRSTPLELMRLASALTHILQANSSSRCAREVTER